MKSASLRHLLLLSGRAISDQVPDVEQSIAEIAATLSVSREGRSDFRLLYERGDEKYETAVTAARFDFYRRGDVAALNEKRAAGLDLRVQNWRAAHLTWAELLDRPELAALDTPPALRVTPVVPDTAADPLRQISDAVGVVVPLAVAIATRRVAPVVAGAVAAGVLLSDTTGGRRFAGLAAAGAGATSGPVGPGALIAAAASVVASLDVPKAPAPLRYVALPGVAGLATALSPGFGAAVVLGAFSDGLAGGIGRRDPDTIRTVGARVAGVAAGIAAGRRGRRGNSSPGANGAVTAAVSALLIGETAVRVMEGSRDRLAPVVQPLGLALAAVWRRDRRLAAALGVGVVAASAAHRIAVRRAAARPTAPMPVAAPGTPVSLRRRGDELSGAS